MGVENNGADNAAARRLLAKIRSFVADQLDDHEAALFAALVAPGARGSNNPLEHFVLRVPGQSFTLTAERRMRPKCTTPGGGLAPVPDAR